MLIAPVCDTHDARRMHVAVTRVVDANPHSCRLTDRNHEFECLQIAASVTPDRRFGRKRSADIELITAELGTYLLGNIISGKLRNARNKVFHVLVTSARTLNKPAAADAGGDGNGAVQVRLQQGAQADQGYAVHGDSSGGDAMVGVVFTRPHPIHRNTGGVADEVGDTAGFATSLNDIADVGGGHFRGLRNFGLAATALLERGLDVGWMHCFAPTG